jgi:hypothetical protein
VVSTLTKQPDLALDGPPFSPVCSPEQCLPMG